VRSIKMMYILSLFMFFVASSAWAASDLQQQLQSARLLLDQPAPDVGQLKVLNVELKAAVLSESDTRFQDSTCHTIALIEQAISANPQGHEWALTLCTSDPAVPWMKFALPYVWPVGGSSEDQLEVADKLLDMSGIHPDEPWANEFKATLFRAYITEQLWDPAAFLGVELLRANYNLAASDQLALANALLSSNRTEDAQHVLFTLSNNSAPNTPEALRASVELGLIEQFLKHDLQAKGEFEQAWNIWDKQKKRPGFEEPLVSNAAARARWELLQFEFAALEKKFQVSMEWSAKEAARWCNDLEKNTNDLLTVAPSYESAVAVLTGKLHRLHGDALFRLGMYSSRQEDLAARDRLRDQALLRFDEAANLFLLTAGHKDKALPALAPGHWSSQTANFQLEAKQLTYELYIHAADQLEMWSESLWQKTPLRSFGQNGYTPRFDAIVHEALPVLDKCVEYRKLALRYARQNPDVKNTNLSVLSVYIDLLNPISELRKLCGSQWQTTSSNATQISRTLGVTRNPDAVESMSLALEQQISEANKLAGESSVALEKVITKLFASIADHDSLSILAEHKLAMDREYAAMNRIVHETLDLATNNLDRRDPKAASLRSKLYKFSVRAADQELETLEEGHEWAVANGYNSEGGKELYARLSERDPTKYPLRGGIWSADRK
jgi:hypothetical protein